MTPSEVLFMFTILIKLDFPFRGHPYSKDEDYKEYPYWRQVGGGWAKPVRTRDW